MPNDEGDIESEPEPWGDYAKDNLDDEEVINIQKVIEKNLKN